MLKILAVAAIMAAAPAHSEPIFHNGTGKIAFGLGIVAASKNDKVQHFGAGLAISGAGQKMGLNFWEGCALALGAGLAKEIYDHLGNGVVDAGDVAATVAGCIRIKFEW